MQRTRVGTRGAVANVTVLPTIASTGTDASSGVRSRRRRKHKLCLLVAAATLFIVYTFVRFAVTQVLSGAWDQDCRGKVMVIYAGQDIPALGLMKQGFMSEALNVIGALAYGLEHQAAGLKVHFETPIYSDPSRDSPNYWGYFFDSYITFGDSSDAHSPPPATTRVATASETHYNRYIARFGKFGFFSQVLWGKGRHHWPFPLPRGQLSSSSSIGGGRIRGRDSDGHVGDQDADEHAVSLMGCSSDCGVGLARASMVAQKYIRLLPSMQRKVDAFVTEHFAGRFVIGVHYRGLDKFKLWPYKGPTYAAIVAEVERQEALYHKRESALGREPLPVFVFVATDEKEAFEFVQARYPGRTLSYDRSAAVRLNRSKAAALYGAHKTPIRGAGPFLKGESVVMDMFLLTRTKYLIRNKSSVSAVALLLLPASVGCTFFLTDDLVWEFPAGKARGDEVVNVRRPSDLPKYLRELPRAPVERYELRAN